MKRILLLSFALVIAGTELAQAQIIQPRRGFEPLAWASLGVGWLQLRDICDPDTDSCWTFGDAPQFRAGLEYPISAEATIGIAGTMAKLPLFWADDGTTANACGQCDADVNVNQLFGNFRLGGGPGFHQVIELVVGATMFQNFRRTDGAKLGPGTTVTDLSFGVGFGVGYSITNRVQFTRVQDWGIIMHERQPGNPSNTSQQMTLRVGGRFALGEK